MQTEHNLGWLNVRLDADEVDRLLNGETITGIGNNGFAEDGVTSVAIEADQFGSPSAQIDGSNVRVALPDGRLPAEIPVEGYGIRGDHRYLFGFSGGIAVFEAVRNDD